MGGSISGEDRETVQMGAISRLERMCTLSRVVVISQVQCHLVFVAVHSAVAGGASAACDAHHAAHRTARHRKRRAGKATARA